MDFFEAQEAARRRSRRLIAAFLLALVLVVASYCAAGALLYATWATFWGFSAFPPAKLLVGIAAVAGGTILGVSGFRRLQLADGGAAVAHLLGARYIEPGRATPPERRLLNVVEEMAIASGITVPLVYCLDREEGINALVAGFSPNEAALILTNGALKKLSRDELQGVMGHEFSHILNGDMALNVRLVALLSGLTWLADAAEAMFFRAARVAHGKAREERGGEAFVAVAAAVIAFVGFPGTLAASALKAAVSRERELLADAASVQFTRNPEGIAGALDSILALRAHTVVRAVHSPLFSHMFFAPAVGAWWGFRSHPPIEERIRRAHPRFLRDDYRERRHGTRKEVAVIDGSGQVVKHVGRLEAATLVASIGRPAREHVDHAAKLLAGLPEPLREALHQPKAAEAAMLALAREPGELRAHMLPIAELAVPAIKEQPQKARDAFIAELRAAVEADRRVTLREFVLLTLLTQRLREGAGQPIRTRYRRIAEVARDARVVLSLIALASRSEAQAAFAKGWALLGLSAESPLAREALTSAAINEALERLRHLAPLTKPRLLKACVEAASEDGMIDIAEAELVRTVAATLDCPVPPAIERGGDLLQTPSVLR